MPSSCRSRTARAATGSTLRRTQTKPRLFWSWASTSRRPAASRPSALAEGRRGAGGVARSPGGRRRCSPRPPRPRGGGPRGRGWRLAAGPGRWCARSGARPGARSPRGSGPGAAPAAPARSPPTGRPRSPPASGAGARGARAWWALPRGAAAGGGAPAARASIAPLRLRAARHLRALGRRGRPLHHHQPLGGGGGTGPGRAARWPPRAAGPRGSPSPGGACGSPPPGAHARGRAARPRCPSGASCSVGQA